MKYFIPLFFLASSLWAGKVTILSAANLKFFFSDLIAAYQKQFPEDSLSITYDASGALYKKILSGEKYDIFLAANMDYPEKVYEKGLSATKPKKYAQGAIILLVASQAGLEKEGLLALDDITIEEIAIANKKTAPYGMAAIEALKNSKLYEKLESKIVYSNDASTIIGDVLWYGNAGLLPKSAVGFLPRGYNIEGENWIEIDAKLYRPIKQGFTLSAEGVKNKTAKRFVNYLLNDGQKFFKENGYK